MARQHSEWTFASEWVGIINVCITENCCEGFQCKYKVVTNTIRIMYECMSMSMSSHSIPFRRQAMPVHNAGCLLYFLRPPCCMHIRFYDAPITKLNWYSYFFADLVFGWASRFLEQVHFRFFFYYKLYNAVGQVFYVVSFLFLLCFDSMEALFIFINDLKNLKKKRFRVWLY